MQMIYSQIVPPTQQPLLEECVWAFKNWFDDNLRRPLVDAVGDLPFPPDIEAISAQILELIQIFKKNQGDSSEISVEERLFPLLKRSVSFQRRSTAEAIEKKKQRVHNPDLLQALDEQLHPLDQLTDLQWLRDIVPLPTPSLSDYVSIHQIEEILSNKRIMPADRDYDQKFRILQAPQLFLKDLNYYRTTCELRRVPVVIAYFDIDDFKQKFNAPYGETMIDRNVLPIFMQAVEAHLYSHGWAYRIGGDEFTALVPNVSFDLALALFENLRAKLAMLRFRGIAERTTVSIGLCKIDPYSSLTDLELEERVNKAMKFAKAKKNCIAAYKDSRWDEGSLYTI